ncbi:MAG: hypothetical protein HOP13_20165 [Alphaproteobacteria bacterium]|nr:hypothetical protein [Alphaproteobacteria bacterium]
MAGEVEQVAGGKLRRRATILMTGAALTGFYMWMQPAALGTLEANSAQAADGTGGCVMRLGNEEVRVHSRELCGTVQPTPASFVAPEAPAVPAAEPPADLLRTTAPVDVIREPAARASRFASAMPRVKPKAPSLASGDAAPEIEPREHAALIEDDDRWRDDGADREAGLERDDRDTRDVSEQGGGDRDYCERDGRDRDGGEGGEGGEHGGEGRGY